MRVEGKFTASTGMTDTLTMSTRERQYLEVLQRLGRGELTRAAAAIELDVSERQVYRLVSRYRREGDAGMVHRLRGRASNRGHGEATRARVLQLYKQREYRDYGPQLFSEVLEERLKLQVSSETVRQWLMASGLWSGRRAPRRHRKKRERREGIGTLVQFDGSEHDWFEGRGPVCCLLVAIDDASSRVFMRFAPSEDTAHVMRTLWQYVEQYGIPRALYTDHGSVYTPTQGEALTEVGRALQQLGVEMIFANSPQAKGRVERSNRTHQDRLIKAMRHKGIATIEDANRYLDEHYLAEHNRRYACVEGKPDVHRTCFGLALEQIFCFETKRQVRNDYTLMLEGGFLQLERADGPDAAPLPPPKTMVTVRRWLDGSLHLTWNETELAFRTLEEKPEPKPQQRPPAQHPWRKKPVSETGKQTREIFLRSG
jgi:hypothetical protein